MNMELSVPKRRHENGIGIVPKRWHEDATGSVLKRRNEGGTDLSSETSA